MTDSNPQRLDFGRGVSERLVGLPGWVAPATRMFRPGTHGRLQEHRRLRRQGAEVDQSKSRAAVRTILVDPGSKPRWWSRGRSSRPLWPATGGVFGYETALERFSNAAHTE